MTILHGWEFCREQHHDATLTSIPIVVITASGHTHVPGARAVLSKPLAVETVLKALQRDCGPPTVRT